MSKLEDHLIGMMLRDIENIKIARALALKREHLLNPNSQACLEAIYELNDMNIAPELESVAMKVPSHMLYLADCFMGAPIAMDFTWLAGQLIENFHLRSVGLELSHLVNQLSALSELSNKQALRQKALDILRLLEANQGVESKSLKIGSQIWPYIDLLGQRVSDYSLGVKRGIASKFGPLNRAFGGWVAERLYIIAARPSIGKTTLAANFFHEALRLGHKGVFFTNEMSGADIIEKLISIEARLPGDVLFTGSLGPEHMEAVHAATKKIYPWSGFVNERSGRYLESFESEIRNLKRKECIEFVVLDYIQQMKVEGKTFLNRHQELSHISDHLKQLSRELKIAIIALAQINRDVERIGKPMMPNLSHLKDSGALEQDADVVIILHRDREDLDPTKAILNLAKNRYGKTGYFEIKAYLDRNAFEEL